MKTRHSKTKVTSITFTFTFRKHKTAKPPGTRRAPAAAGRAGAGGRRVGDAPTDGRRLFSRCFPGDRHSITLERAFTLRTTYVEASFVNVCEPGVIHPPRRDASFCLVELLIVAPFKTFMHSKTNDDRHSLSFTAWSRSSVPSDRRTRRRHPPGSSPKSAVGPHADVQPEGIPSSAVRQRGKTPVSAVARRKPCVRRPRRGRDGAGEHADVGDGDRAAAGHADVGDGDRAAAGHADVG